LGATQLLHIWDLGPLRDSPLVTISLIIPKKLNFLHFSPVNSTPFRSTPAARWSIASAPFGSSSFQLVDWVSMSTGIGSLLCQASSTWPGAIVPQLRFWLSKGQACLIFLITLFYMTFVINSYSPSLQVVLFGPWGF
jgi:hypothetical protein